MSAQQSLFDAHYPDRCYLTELCDHYYCDFLSVAVLRRSPDQTVRPFAHSHAAYEFLLPLTPAPQIMQGDDVYFGRVAMPIPSRAVRGTRRPWSFATCRIAALWSSRRISSAG